METWKVKIFLFTYTQKKIISLYVSALEKKLQDWPPGSFISDEPLKNRLNG